MKQLNQMLQQAQLMQKKVDAVQSQLDAHELEGTSGAGLVRATVTGKGDVKKLAIDKSLCDPAEVEILEDLVVAAIKDAKNKADAYANAEMAKVTGDIKLPGGMKFPF